MRHAAVDHVIRYGVMPNPSPTGRDLMRVLLHELIEHGVVAGSLEGGSPLALTPAGAELHSRWVSPSFRHCVCSCRLTSRHQHG